MAVIQEYKCPCCGGAIAFDSTLQKMKCPFCDTEFDVESLRAYDADLHEEGKDDMHWETPPSNEWKAEETEGMRVWLCKSCGGEIIGDETTGATACPYCGNPVVMMGQFRGALRPDYVIPFKLDREAAKAGLLRHLEGKHFLPKVFRDQNHIDEIRGVYVPFWMFDADVQANLRYRATRVRSWSDSRYIYTETSYFSAVRGGDIAFENIPVDGSSKISNNLTESIEPYDFSEAVDFQTAYLAGYLADKYDVDAQKCIERANERIKTSTEAAFAETVKGFTTVTREGGSVKLQEGSRAKYVLCPVWLLSTTWNGSSYTFAMNGQTGKFVGDLPLDRSAYSKWLIGLTAAISAGVFALSYLLWLL